MRIYTTKYGRSCKNFLCFRQHNNQCKFCLFKHKYLVSRICTLNIVKAFFVWQFSQWLLENECYDVCAWNPLVTGKYQGPVFNLLEDQINVTIANPKWVKVINGDKYDTKYSKQTGDLFQLELVKGNYIPCKSICILQEQISECSYCL